MFAQINPADKDNLYRSLWGRERGTNSSGTLSPLFPIEHHAQKMFPNLSAESTSHLGGFKTDKFPALWLIKWPADHDWSGPCDTFLSSLDNTSSLCDGRSRMWLLISCCLVCVAAERVTSLGKDWHRPCLKCEKCNKTLSAGSHAEVRKSELHNNTDTIHPVGNQQLNLRYLHSFFKRIKATEWNPVVTVVTMQSRHIVCLVAAAHISL